MERSTKLLKSFANHFAEVASSEDCIQVLRMFQHTGLWRQPSEYITKEASTDRTGWPDTTNTRATEGAKAERVGIWERNKNTGCFTRRLDMVQEWGWWANMGQIKPKGTKKRVLMIGESVARGYFYDPQLTPTKTLETILRPQLGKNGVEVIDLARTGLEMEVKELAISALLLEPDVVVIFSGNNWGLSYSISMTDIPYIVSILHERGIPGLKHFYEEQLAEIIKDMVQTLASVYQTRNIPLIWIIPEFNLGDWRDPITNAPHLHNDSNREWMTHWEGARAALKEGNIKLAMELAEKMVELDQKVCVTGLYILAECSLRQGDLDTARYYLECARDATIWYPSAGRWYPSMYTPRPNSVVQKTLREEASKHKHEIVDLPMLFGEYLNGKLPDRGLFLDYCHLTSEGIRISMAAAASCVMRVLRGSDISWAALLHQSPEPSSKVEAAAAFLAAVHNAHWDQQYDLVHYYCLRALRLAPDIAQVMTRFIDIQSRRLPMLLSKASEEIADLEWPSIHRYLFRFNNQRMDKLLLEAMVNSLKEVNICYEERLDQIRREEHSMALGKTNLLEYYYSSAADQPLEAMWVRPSFPTPGDNYYYKAYSSESKFYFVSDAFCPVRLSLTCRLPHSATSKDVILIAINGGSEEEIVVSREWTTWDIAVEVMLVRSGLNEVIIRWPVPIFPGKQGIEAIATDILHRIPPAFYCTFGEIHSFTVSDAREPGDDRPCKPGTGGLNGTKEK
jgi:hypothetical protein